MENKPTGKTRLKTISIGSIFNKRIVLIHQTEVEIEHMDCNGGIITTDTFKSWYDTKPEWLLEIKNNETRGN
jgi:hypothetical protein